MGEIMLIVIWTILGSFIYCQAIRYHQNIKSKLSICDHCQNKILPVHNIPIISFIYLRGRCHHCNQRINVKHFIFEIIGLIIGLLLSYNDHSLIVHIQIGILFYIFCADLEHQLIPDRAILLLLLLNINKEINLLLILFCLFLCLFVVFELFGFGDVKLIFVTSLGLTFYQVNLIILTSSLLTIIMMLLLRFIKKTTLSTPFPFGCSWVVSFLWLSHLI